jgi:CTP:molybdopterin cytidylyltransferase MocA
MGTPKALVRDDDGSSWLLRSVEVLRRGGCYAVTVVLGAESAQAARLLAPEDVAVVVAEDWAEGMGASLRAGLGAIEDSDAFAALVHLVDLPDVTAGVVTRLVDAGAQPGAHVLARASYAGVPGHPVLIGRAHWAGVRASASGDRGARDYLARHDVTLVECGDLASGQDVDSR